MALCLKETDDTPAKVTGSTGDNHRVHLTHLHGYAAQRTQHSQSATLAARAHTVPRTQQSFSTEVLGPRVRRDDVPLNLRWTGVPAAAGSVAVVVDNPDAPAATYTHWLVVNIAPTGSTTSVVPATVVPSSYGHYRADRCGAEDGSERTPVLPYPLWTRRGRRASCHQATGGEAIARWADGTRLRRLTDRGRRLDAEGGSFGYGRVDRRRPAVSSPSPPHWSRPPTTWRCPQWAGTADCSRSCVAQRPSGRVSLAGGMRLVGAVVCPSHRAMAPQTLAKAETRATLGQH
jgi:hypothetical protein